MSNKERLYLGLLLKKQMTRERMTPKMVFDGVTSIYSADKSVVEEREAKLKEVALQKSQKRKVDKDFLSKIDMKDTDYREKTDKAVGK